MKTQSDFNLVVDKWGNVDVDYYQAKAVQMRNEAIAAWFASFRKSVANAARHAFSAPRNTKSA